MRIDISEHVNAICKAFDLNPSYVARLDISPGVADALVFKGKNGHCVGPKYIDHSGEPAQETLTFAITA